MTQDQKQNLITLANGLMNEPERRGTKFDMWRFAEGDMFGYDSLTECGAVGCAVGHAPYYGIEKFATEDWNTYSCRTLLPKSAEWEWCFAGQWKFSDNTKRGAAQRIIYMLQYGVPKSFNDFLCNHGEMVDTYNHIDGFCEYWLKENMQ